MFTYLQDVELAGFTVSSPDFIAEVILAGPRSIHHVKCMTYSNKRFLIIDKGVLNRCWAMVTPVNALPGCPHYLSGLHL